MAEGRKDEPQFAENEVTVEEETDRHRIMPLVGPLIDEKAVQKTGNIEQIITALPAELQRLHQARISQIYTSIRQVNIMITGLSGSGKSTLGNALLGQRPEFTTSRNIRQPCTTNVSSRTIQTEKELKVRVWDTPGLRDGSRNQKQYLEEVFEVFRQYRQEDLVLYCIKAGTRFTVSKENDNVQAMIQLNKKFKKKIWDKTIFVITFANSIVNLPLGRTEAQIKYEFNTTMTDYQIQIKDILKNFCKVDARILDNISVIPAAHCSLPHLPGRQYWFSALWFQCLHSIPTVEGRAAMLEHSRSRVVDPGNETPEGLQRGQIVLTDEFIPSEILRMKREYQEKGEDIGVSLGLLGLLGGPLFLLTVPIGYYAGQAVGRYLGTRAYLEGLQQDN